MKLGGREHAVTSEKPSVEAKTFSGQKWEYRARNLKKVAGLSLERDFNEHGAAGWEFCAMAKDGEYAIFKRPVNNFPAGGEFEIDPHLVS